MSGPFNPHRDTGFAGETRVLRHLKSMTFVAGLLFAVALPQSAGAQQWSDIKQSPPLVLKGQGSFFVGGSTHAIESKYISPSIFSEDSGDAMINQMYVQFQLPQKAIDQFPIVFVHGCCLTSKTWETTPDGRMGWYEYFTRKGFNTYMGEQVGRGRSGFDALRYQKVLTGDLPGSANPAILIATDKFAWNVFRWGDYATKTPYPDERFPMQTVGVGKNATFDFYKQVIPDLNATLSDASSPTCANGTCTPSDPNARFNSPDNMASLANQLGGAILVGHSQSSGFPTMAALRPGSMGVRGIIQLETGCFANLTQANIQVLKHIPILIMVGDHFSTPQPPASCVAMKKQLDDAGGDMTFIALPDLGIRGNSHMFMQDNNNLKVADIIISWIKKHVKYKDRRPPHGDRDHHH
jgi:hypothetical protein